MATLDVYDRSGNVLHQKELSDEFVNAPINEAVIHQCVVAHLANRRQGTASAKTRSEVNGSNRKLYRQKGTGRARAGDSGSPTRVHGGVAFAPKPRSYRQDTPKKVRRLGLQSALADRFQNDQCVLIEDFVLERPRTKDMTGVLDALNLDGKVLFVLDQHDPNVYLSIRNLPQVHSCTWDLLNVYDVLWHDKIVITEQSAEKLVDKFAESIDAESTDAASEEG